MLKTLPYIALTSLFLCPTGLRAQIIPDRSLGPESSRVSIDTIKGMESDRIDGGAIRGTNLFHVSSTSIKEQ